MKKTRIEDIDVPPTNSPADVVRPLSEVLNTDSLAINYFELAPSESFGYAYHRHLDQEEVFYIQSGTATFETESGDVEVEEGEVIRFASGEFQLGRNQSDERVIAFALGAPRGTEEIEYRRECSICNDQTIQNTEVTEEQNAILTRCTECNSVLDEISL